MTEIALVSCVKVKQKQASPIRDLYTSTWYRLARAYVEANYDCWHILSARWGFVADLETIVDPYEESLLRMKVQQRRDWAKKVAIAINDAYTSPQVFHIFAGRHYREHLIPALEKAGHQTVIPLCGLGIGEQMAWLKSQSP